MIRLLAERTRTTTCTYDRVVDGHERPTVRARRTFYDVTADLHQLAGAAHLATPYLLVGSSGRRTPSPTPAATSGRWPASSCSTPGPNLELGEEFPGRLAWRTPSTSTGSTPNAAGVARPAAARPHPAADRDRDPGPVERAGPVVLAQAVVARARQPTLEGGHDLPNENILGVVDRFRRRSSGARLARDLASEHDRHHLARVACRSCPADAADAAEVVVEALPAPDGTAGRLELDERVLVHPRLGVDDLGGKVDGAWT